MSKLLWNVLKISGEANAPPLVARLHEIVNGWESSIAVLTKIIGQPIFWRKNLKFWLQNLQILTLLRLINFLRLKLQNNSAFGVDVNSEANSFRMLQTFKEFGYLTLAMIYLVSTLKATVESNLGIS